MFHRPEYGFANHLSLPNGATAETGLCGSMVSQEAVRSVVAASLARELAATEDVPVLYFFFRHANLANKTPQQMAIDWLSQLFEHGLLLQSRLKTHEAASYP